MFTGLSNIGKESRKYTKFDEHIKYYEIRATGHLDTPTINPLHREIAKAVPSRGHTIQAQSLARYRQRRIISSAFREIGLHESSLAQLWLCTRGSAYPRCSHIFSGRAYFINVSIVIRRSCSIFFK